MEPELIILNLSLLREKEIEPTEPEPMEPEPTKL